MRVCFLIVLLFVLGCQSEKSLTKAQLYQNLKDASLEILVNGQRSGSASFISRDGYILSASHIFNKEAKYEGMNAKGEIFPVTIVGLDRSSDLALLKADLKALSFLQVSTSELNPGDDVYQFGTAFYRKCMMQHGVVCQDEPTFEYYGGASNHGVEVLHVSTSVQPGTSGGPWVNTKGEVVGVQSGILTINKSNSGMANVAPLNKIQNLIKAKKSARTPTLEVTIETLLNQPPRVLKVYEDRKGVVIVGVLKNGIGEKSGLKKDDLILTVHGSKMFFEEDYYKAVRSSEDLIKLKIYRPSEKAEKDLEIKPAILELRFFKKGKAASL
jgi:serine protease Do